MSLPPAVPFLNALPQNCKMFQVRHSCHNTSTARRDLERVSLHLARTVLKPIPAPMRISCVRKSRRWWLVLSLLLTGGLTLWIGADILYPTRADLRAFDAHAVARLETQMWRSYYEHHVIRLFNELAELLQRQYVMPFWRSRVAAYQAARAAVTFQRGHNRSEYLNALPNLGQLLSARRAQRARAFRCQPSRSSRTRVVDHTSRTR